MQFDPIQGGEGSETHGIAGIGGSESTVSQFANKRETTGDM